MRVLHFLLEVRGDKYYLGEELFTGFSYEVESESDWMEHPVEIVAERAIIAGVVVGVDQESPKVPRLACTHIRSSIGRTDSFVGLTYEFNQDNEADGLGEQHGILGAESEVEIGVVKEAIFWRESGVLTAHSWNTGSRCTWANDGSFGGVTADLAKISYYEDGSLMSLSFLGEVANEGIVRDHPLVAGSDLTLRGLTMSDWVLAHITGLEKVESLTLERTGLTGVGLRAFAKSPLKKLYVVYESKITDKEFSEFLAAKPDCKWLDHRGYD